MSNTKWLASVAGVSSGLVTAWLTHPVAGVIAAVIAWITVLRMSHGEDGPSSQGRSDVVVALDRVGVCLRAGASVPTALRVSSDCAEPPTMELLRRLADDLTYGGRSTDAALGPDGPPEPAGWTQAEAVIRAGENHGTRLASQLQAVGEDLRQQRREMAERRCQRTGVLAMLPLGCCFLPAFLLIAVVPLVLTLLGGLPEVL